MKIRHIFILLLALFAALSAKAQNISVASFRLLEMDMTANLEPNIRIDQNGYTCALIKMVTTETGFTWNVGVMGITDTQQQAGEIWVWVPFGVKHLTIGHPRFGILRDYYFPIPIEKARTYELVLKTNGPGPGPDEDLGGSFLVMSVSPTNAKVSVDGQMQETADGIVTVFLEYGKHNYRVEAPNCETEVGIVEIGREKKEMEVKLKSSQATLALTCADKDAEIYINDKKYGVGSCSCALNAGTYLAEARKQGHRTEKQVVVLSKKEQKTLVLNAPTPMFGKLKLTSTPANCEVYLDGKKIGKSPDVFADILVGSHTVELHKNGYESQRQKVDIEEGKITDFSMTLTRTGGQAQQPQTQKPETKPQQNEKPAKPAKPAPTKQTFIMANAAYCTAPQTSFGLTFGQVKRFGWYVNFMTNFNFTKGDFKCNDYGYPLPLESSPSYALIGESSTSRLSLTAGAMLRCAKPFCLYLGAGYGKRSLLWKTSDGSYATADAYSYQGLAIDAGTMLHFDGFSLSVGATSVGFAYWEAKLGIGFNF